MERGSGEPTTARGPSSDATGCPLGPRGRRARSVDRRKIVAEASTSGGPRRAARIGGTSRGGGGRVDRPRRPAGAPGSRRFSCRARVRTRRPSSTGASSRLPALGRPPRLGEPERSDGRRHGTTTGGACGFARRGSERAFAGRGRTRPSLLGHEKASAPSPFGKCGRRRSARASPGGAADSPGKPGPRAFFSGRPPGGDVRRGLGGPPSIPGP